VISKEEKKPGRKEGKYVKKAQKFALHDINIP
jgi:hypothetical protein